MKSFVLAALILSMLTACDSGSYLVCSQDGRLLLNETNYNDIRDLRTHHQVCKVNGDNSITVKDKTDGSQ